MIFKARYIYDKDGKKEATENVELIHIFIK